MAIKIGQEEKEIRRQELLLIGREKERIDLDKRNLEEQRRQVEAREARLFELEGKYRDITINPVSQTTLRISPGTRIHRCYPPKS